MKQSTPLILQMTRKRLRKDITNDKKKTKEHMKLSSAILNENKQRNMNFKTSSDRHNYLAISNKNINSGNPIYFMINLVLS